MNQTSWRAGAFILIAALALVAALAPDVRGSAATPTTASQTPDAKKAEGAAISLWSTIKAGGVIGFLIVLMSLISVAFVIEHCVSIRRSQLVPAGLAAELEGHLKAKRYPDAQALCAADGSFLAHVVAAGLSQIGAMFGFFDMQSAMQEVSEREISKLYRKLEYLSFIAATAPMLGLLGTVTGMIRAFQQIAEVSRMGGTVKPYQLAEGISEALVTTCLGLIVAIPTMFFVALFRNRIDGFVAEAETVVERLMSPFRKGTE